MTSGYLVTLELVTLELKIEIPINQRLVKIVQVQAQVAQAMSFSIFYKRMYVGFSMWIIFENTEINATNFTCCLDWFFILVWTKSWPIWSFF